MTRRDLARLAAGTGIAMQVRAASPENDTMYTGALDGFESKIDPKQIDPVLYTQNLSHAIPQKLAFRAADAPKWQSELRAKITELLGGFPASRSALQPTTLEAREFPDYVREKFIFQSRPDTLVLGYLLTPKKLKAPFATMVCVPGHGRGVDDIVGIDAKGQDRTNKDGYQHDFAIQAVEHGMAAVAIEPMAFGCRRDPINKKKGLDSTACTPSAGAALLLGQTMIGWRVYDVMRTIDWIATRKELDSNRVGCMGVSGGGTCTLFSAALEPRIKVAMVSGYLNTFRGCIMSVAHCIDNYIPGVMQWAEMYDIAGLIAPKPVFFESGERDKNFPIAYSRESFGHVKKIYEAFGVPDAAQHETFDGPHTFWGKRGLPFLAKNLNV